MVNASLRLLLVVVSFFDLVFWINNDILLGTGYQGLSTDGGKTWSRVRSKLSGFTVKNSLYILIK